MKERMHLYYDEEGDFLEINMGNPTKGHFKNLGKGIFERIDEKGKVKGIAIMGFKKRTKGPKAIKLKLPIEVNFSKPLSKAA